MAMATPLEQSATRRAFAWFVAASLLWSGTVVVVPLSYRGPRGLLGMSTAALAGAAAVTILSLTIGVMLLMLYVTRPLALVARPRDVMFDASGRIANIAEALVLASGMRRVHVWRLDCDAPNVGVLPGKSGNALVVTRGADQICSRAELEAVCALQLAMVSDWRLGHLRTAAANVSLLRVSFFVVAPVLLTPCC